MHNELREVRHHIFLSSGIRPEIKKPGLLRARALLGASEEDGNARDGPGGAEGRRPADIDFIPTRNKPRY